MSNIFYMLVGLPSSGKTSYAKKHLSHCKIHSSDDLRIELFGSVDVQDQNHILFKELHSRVKKDLSKGFDVVYDATNISYKKRKAFLQEINYINCTKTCVLIATPYELCLRQNIKRDRTVMAEVIKRMYQNFTIPQYYEGWDKIEIAFHPDSEAWYEPIHELMPRLKTIEQNNPYHTMTIGNHCIATRNNFIEKNGLNSDWDMWLASYIHDIGKEFTKEYNEEKGYDTYYQHHLIGAYMSLFITRFDYCCVSVYSILKVADYIQWHMKPFFIKTEKAKNKFINLVGEEEYNYIMDLHGADKGAK